MIEAGRAFIVGRQRREWGNDMRSSFTRFAAMAMAAVGLALSPLPLSAPMTEIDPNTAIDSDLDNPQQVPPPPVTGETPDYGAPAPDSSLASDLATGDQPATAVPADATRRPSHPNPPAGAPHAAPP